MNILNYPMIFIMIVAAIIAVLMALITKLLVDQKRVKEIQEQVKVHNKKLMKATREKNQEEIDKLNKDKPRIMQMQSELMKMQMPVFMAMFPFIIVFFLLRQLATSMGWGQFMALPSDPYEWPMFGQQLGWFGWYLICSLPFNSFFRKALGVR